MTERRRGRPRAAAGENASTGGKGRPAKAALPEEAAQNLRRLLDERGLSGAELARRMGVTQATVSRWLTRAQGMPFGTLRRLAEVLEVPYSAILVPGAPPEGDPLGLLKQEAERLTEHPAGTAGEERLTRRQVVDALSSLHDELAEVAAAVGALREEVAQATAALASLRLLLTRHDERVRALEARQRKARRGQPDGEPGASGAAAGDDEGDQVDPETGERIRWANGNGVGNGVAPAAPPGPGSRRVPSR